MDGCAHHASLAPSNDTSKLTWAFQNITSLGSSEVTMVFKVCHARFVCFEITTQVLCPPPWGFPFLLLSLLGEMRCVRDYYLSTLLWQMNCYTRACVWPFFRMLDYKVCIFTNSHKKCCCLGYLTYVFVLILIKNVSVRGIWRREFFKRKYEVWHKVF